MNIVRPLKWTWGLTSSHSSSWVINLISCLSWKSSISLSDSIGESLLKARSSAGLRLLNWMYVMLFHLKVVLIVLFFKLPFPCRVLILITTNYVLTLWILKHWRLTGTWERPLLKALIMSFSSCRVTTSSHALWVNLLLFLTVELLTIACIQLIISIPWHGIRIHVHNNGRVVLLIHMSHPIYHVLQLLA